MALGLLVAATTILVGTVGSSASTADWGRVIGGTGSDTAGRIAVDGAGNTYVTGTFTGTVAFGDGPSDTLTARGQRDVYLAKYGPDGSPRWWRRIGNTFNDNAGDVAVGPGGQVVVTGTTFGGARFDTPTGELALVNRGGWDVFVARYLPDGTLQWARNNGGPGTDTVYGLTIDAWSRITLTGAFTQTATFGSGAAPPTLTAVGYEDAFVASYAPDGTTRWARTLAGGGSQDIGYAVVAHDGALIAAATFSGAATVDGRQLFATTLSSGSAIVVRLDPATGAVTWIDQVREPFRGSGFVIPQQLRGLPGGDVVLAGTQYGTSEIGPAGEPPTAVVSGAGRYDGVVIRIGPGGAVRWVAALGGVDDDHVTALAVSPTGLLTVGGTYSGTASFGTSPGAPVLAAGAGDYGFLARLDGTGAGVAAENIGDDPVAGGPAPVTVGGIGIGGGRTRLAVTTNRPVDVGGVAYPTGQANEYDGLLLAVSGGVG